MKRFAHLPRSSSQKYVWHNNNKTYPAALIESLTKAICSLSVIDKQPWQQILRVRKDILKVLLLEKAKRNKKYVKRTDLHRNDRIIAHNYFSWMTGKTYKNHIYEYKL